MRWSAGRPARPSSAGSVRCRNARILGIRRHSKLRDVETFFFNFWRDAHAFHFVDAPEDGVGSTERPNCIQSRSHQLDHELAGIAVEQSCDSLACVAEI